MRIKATVEAVRAALRHSAALAREAQLAGWAWREAVDVERRQQALHTYCGPLMIDWRRVDSALRLLVDVARRDGVCFEQLLDDVIREGLRVTRGLDVATYEGPERTWRA